MSILEQVDVFLESDRKSAVPVKIEDGYLIFGNMHWPYMEPYVVADGKAILLESDKNGSIKKGFGKVDVKGLLERNGFTNPKAVRFNEIEGVLIYQDDENEDSDTDLSSSD